jgi:hypothetical protein
MWLGNCAKIQHEWDKTPTQDILFPHKLHKTLHCIWKVKGYLNTADNQIKTNHNTQHYIRETGEKCKDNKNTCLAVWLQGFWKGRNKDDDRISPIETGGQSMWNRWFSATIPLRFLEFQKLGGRQVMIQVFEDTESEHW